jgi:hypothetical protein
MKKITQLLIAIIVIALVIGTSYQYGGRILSGINFTKPVVKLTISTGINSTTEDLEITNITFEQTQVSKLYRSVDSPVEFPNIEVEGKVNTVASAPITYWASYKRTNPTDKYELILTFREPYRPSTGDVLLLIIKMNDFRGKLEYKTTAFYEWK